MILIDPIAAYLTDLAAQEKFSGVVWITQGEQRLFSAAYGYASRTWKIPNTLDTRFDTASITKLFTAVATLQVIESGAFGLHSSVVQVLGLEDTAISPEVTPFHLLTHSSGIADDVEEEDGESYEAFWLTRPNYTVTTTADFLPQFIHKPPNFPPGQGCRYNNCGFVLLGLMIEKASGLSYRQYVRQQIFKRAGMQQSGFFRLDRVTENLAEGCDPLVDEQDQVVGWKKNIYAFPPVGSPDSGAQVTAADLDRFMRALQQGQLLSEEHTRAIFTPQVHCRDYEDHSMWYGLGMWFSLDLAGRVLFCQKEGINAGVSGMIRHYPVPDINVVILSNLEDGAWQPMRSIHEWIISPESG